jgi:glyoxylase-like metal-dependent hydrolase (beta-lactamase superfamily II)
MSAEVKILIKGYTNANEVGETGEEETQPTITLVKDDGFIIVVDPGILPDQQILIDALNKEGLTVNDVNIVCITHSHIDHYRNIGMFPNAKVLEHFGLWNKNTVVDWAEQFSTNVQVIRTPGHDNSDITLLVTAGPKCGYPGIIAICGDVFWKENYPLNPQDDRFAADPVKLGHSRKMVLKMADWIIPGHGNIYKVNKDQIHEIEDYGPEAPAKKSEIVTICRKCHRKMMPHDRCLCRPWLCHHCCECGLDCDLCGCNHKG